MRKKTIAKLNDCRIYYPNDKKEGHCPKKVKTAPASLEKIMFVG